MPTEDKHNCYNCNYYRAYADNEDEEGNVTALDIWCAKGKDIWDYSGRNKGTEVKPDEGCELWEIVVKKA